MLKKLNISTWLTAFVMLLALNINLGISADAAKDAVEGGDKGSTIAADIAGDMTVTITGLTVGGVVIGDSPEFSPSDYASTEDMIAAILAWLDDSTGGTWTYDGTNFVEPALGGVTGGVVLGAIETEEETTPTPAPTPIPTEVQVLANTGVFLQREMMAGFSVLIAVSLITFFYFRKSNQYNS